MNLDSKELCRILICIDSVSIRGELIEEMFSLKAKLKGMLQEAKQREKEDEVGDTQGQADSA